MARPTSGVRILFVLLVIFSFFSTFIVAQVHVQSQSPFAGLGEIVNGVAEAIQGALESPSPVGQPKYKVPSPPPPGKLSPPPSPGRHIRNATDLAKRRTRGAIIREFVSEHNKVRKQIGQVPLKWDKKLARYAERFGNKRKSDCLLKNSNSSIYGENVYRGEHFERHTATLAVRAWANESKYYYPKTNSCQPNQVCGHYTQMIWRNTKRLGCARSKCNNGAVYILCVYDPPGNYDNESPFTTPMTVD
ncbi:hypothetical protein AQUCO_00700002v1 [Aquilegia coerulea]|uniref:SCP domain-containing protein n=1 Tax=Aquilegia coerulea TaxID=218851 RepID=A0A2G5EI88_AQUCA|nr:hypothetical protein AQUCO_00700002v1 [Aquilegia coerulea]